MRDRGVYFSIVKARVLAFSYTNFSRPNSHRAMQKGPGDICIHSGLRSGRGTLNLENSYLL